MRKSDALAAVLSALALVVVGCDGGMEVDAGRDSSIMLLDGGDGGMVGTDAGPDGGMIGTDAGPDSGMMGDDAGSDAASDAGCMPMVCGTYDCGMIDDGCGTMIDCGLCGIGAPCADDAACDSGECATEAASAWYEGYCVLQCREDVECGAGAHCGFTQQTITRIGTCIRTCTADTDCRGPEYTCQQLDMEGVRECAPVGTGTAAIGDPCTSNADCAGGEDWVCLNESSGYRMGYCSLDCQVDGDCGAGNHCAFVPPTGGDGICLNNCATNGDCRADGYACADADEDGTVLECFRAGTGTTSVGEPCTGIWECAGGADARCLTPDGNDTFDGYCTVFNCATDADCGLGNHCTMFGDGAGGTIGVCQDDCATSADCRAVGYACYDVDGDGSSECWVGGTGTAAPGDACGGSWDCAGGSRARCATGLVDGYCFLTGCTAVGGVGTPTGCPAGSHCSIGTTGGVPDPDGICVDDCATDADCRSDGYRCYDSGDVGTILECYPAATGTGIVGSPCLIQNDCAGDEFGICLLEFDQTATALPDYPGGYCTQLCNAGAPACPGGTTCQFMLFCTENCRVPLDCPRRPDYTCEVPLPDYGGMGNACWPG